MKKTLVSALTTALVVGAASTTFAAANPFSDVPADHWAYDAVSQLAADGVIEGYGDSTFKGNRNITRYEMAQMVAKAMAKTTSGVDKALVDKLAAEFSEELNNLGVRVSNLERNADMVKWNGEARYTYTHDTYKAAGQKRTEANGPLLLRLEPTAEVNDHWKVKARLDATTRAEADGPNGDEDRVRMKRVWAQGNYDKFQVKAGKFGSLNNDSFADTDFTGAELSYGKEVKGILGFGRLNASALNGRENFRTGGLAANWRNVNLNNAPKAALGYQYLGVEYKKDKLNAGLTWHHLKGVDGGFGARYTRNANGENTMNIFAVKAGYKFSKNVAANAWYTWNNKADLEKKAASIEVDYKGAQKENKGTWGAWIAYRHIGANAVVKSTYDVIKEGEKGWEIGANYTFFKNVVGTLRYGKDKLVNNRGLAGAKGDRFFGRVQFFF